MFVHRVDIRDPKVTRMHSVTQSVTSVVCETRVQKRDVFDILRYDTHAYVRMKTIFSRTRNKCPSPELNPSDVK